MRSGNSKDKSKAMLRGKSTSDVIQNARKSLDDNKLVIFIYEIKVKMK